VALQERQPLLGGQFNSILLYSASENWLDKRSGLCGMGLILVRKWTTVYKCNATHLKLKEETCFSFFWTVKKLKENSIFFFHEQTYKMLVR
jgi:hypothetical protein